MPDQQIPVEQVLTVAYISLGCNEDGKVSIEVRAKTSFLNLTPSIKDMWERAAQAFVDEFSKGESLLAVAALGGENSPLREKAIEQAQRDGAQITNNVS